MKNQQDEKLYMQLEEFVYGFYDVLGLMESLEILTSSITIEESSHECRALRCGVYRMTELLNGLKALLEYMQSMGL